MHWKNVKYMYAFVKNVLKYALKIRNYTLLKHSY